MSFLLFFPEKDADKEEDTGKEEKEKKESFPCPACRAQIAIPENGVDGLKVTSAYLRKKNESDLDG